MERQFDENMTAFEALAAVEMKIEDQLEELAKSKEYYTDQLARVNNEIRTTKKAIDIVQDQMKHL